MNWKDDIEKLILERKSMVRKGKACGNCGEIPKHFGPHCGSPIVSGCLNWHPIGTVLVKGEKEEG